jgi:hypothetical protein
MSSLLLIYVSLGIFYSILTLSHKISSYDEFGLVVRVFLNTHAFSLDDFCTIIKSSLPSQSPSLAFLQRCGNKLSRVKFQNER